MLAGIRADGATLATFPAHECTSGQKGQRGRPVASKPSSTLPLRGQRSLGQGLSNLTPPSCFPLNCAGLKSDTSTNRPYSTDDLRRHRCQDHKARPNLQSRAPLAIAKNMTKLEDLADRVDRLIVRHDELRRTNALLVQQLGVVSQERDSLRSRLGAARSRIDALLERLPQEASTDNLAARANKAPLP